MEEEILCILADRLQTTSNLILNRNLRRRLPVRSCNDVITTGSLDEVCQYSGFPRRRVCKLAAKRNDLALFQAARQRQLPIASAWKVAAKTGLIPFLERMYSIVESKFKEIAFLTASHGQINTLKWIVAFLVGIGVPKEKYWFNMIAGSAAYSYEMLIFSCNMLGVSYVKERIVRIRGLSHNACDLRTLMWLRANQSQWSRKTCANAARLGNLTMLQWARDNGCPWDVECTTQAAENNHLDLLKWAHENGCPWSAKALGRAAKNGHKTVVQWLFDNGAPCDHRTARGAAAHSLEMLQFCIDCGAPRENLLLYQWVGIWPTMTQSAAYRGCQATLDWLESRQLLDMDAVAIWAIWGGHFELAKRYVERGSECPDLESVLTSKYPSLHLLEWLHQHHAHIDEEDFMSFALRRHELEILRWADHHQLFTDSFDVDLNWPEMIDDDPELLEMSINLVQKLQ